MRFVEARLGALTERERKGATKMSEGLHAQHMQPTEVLLPLANKPHFPEQTASFPRHAPLFPDTLTLLLGLFHAWILVNFSQIMVDCTV
jgi:hypothetical protein